MVLDDFFEDIPHENVESLQRPPALDLLTLNALVAALPRSFPWRVAQPFGGNLYLGCPTLVARLWRRAGTAV